MKKFNRNTKLLAVFNFFIIISILTIIFINGNANSYEISIYNAYPAYFWFLIIISLFMGTIILIREYFNEDFNNWIYGFLSILITNSILLSLPLARNYFIYGRGDVLTHIGFMKDILFSGNIGSNMYPLLHILGVFLYEIAGIEIKNVPMIFPIFSIFFIISFYCLFNQIFNDKKKVLLSMVPASLLFYGTIHTLFSPFTTSFLIIPFYLYCYYNSRVSKNKTIFAIITVILSLFITFLHPITCIIIIGLLLTGEISFYIYSNLKDKNNLSKVRKPFTLITIMGICFLMWQSYAYYFIRSFSSIINWLTDGTGESQFQKNIAVVEYAQPNLINLIESIFYSYGQWIIISIISLLTITYLIKNINKLSFINVFSSVGYIFFLLWSIVIFFVIQIFGFGRIMIVAILFSTFLVSTFLSIVISNKNKILQKNHNKAFIICLILLPILFFSTFNLFYSPYTNIANEQVTKGEYFGMLTFFSIRNENYQINELEISHYRFFDAIYGSKENNLIEDQNLNISRKNVIFHDTKPLNHFGYDEYISMSDYYNETTYLIINSIGKIKDPAVIPEQPEKWRYTINDFEKLNYDTSLTKFLDNGNLNIYLIK